MSCERCGQQEEARGFAASGYCLKAWPHTHINEALGYPSFEVQRRVIDYEPKP